MKETPERPFMDSKEKFVQLLTSHQNALFTYIRAAVGDYSTARDVLQEVNVTLWRKAETFEEGTNFRGWALRTAKFKVLSSFRDRKRSRLFYDEESLERLAEDVEGVTAKWEQEERLEALEGCLELLPPKQRDLLSRRYSSGENLKGLAVALGQSVGALKMILLRARRSLLDCILTKTSGGLSHEG